VSCSSLRAWKNLQRPLPLDSISSLFLLDVEKPTLLSFNCRLPLPLLEPSSSVLSDSLRTNQHNQNQ
jgi:hypothetical protein